MRLLLEFCLALRTQISIQIDTSYKSRRASGKGKVVRIVPGGLEYAVVGDVKIWSLRWMEKDIKWYDGSA